MQQVEKEIETFRTYDEFVRFPDNEEHTLPDDLYGINEAATGMSSARNILEAAKRILLTAKTIIENG